MLHTILSLVAAICVVSIFINHFLFDGKINWWAVLTCVLVIVANLRELQFDREKANHDDVLRGCMDFHEATCEICDSFTLYKIRRECNRKWRERQPYNVKAELRKPGDMTQQVQDSREAGNEKQ